MRLLGALALTLVLAAPVPARAFVFAYRSDGSILGAHLRVMDDLVALFRKEHPECSITFRHDTDFVEAFVAAQGLDRTSEVPDVVVLYRTTWPRLLPEDKLHPLSDALTPADLATLRQAIRPELFRDYYGKKVAAGTYALPLERSFPALLINLEALPELKGRETVSWDELFHVLKIRGRNQGKAGAPFVLPVDHWTATYVLSNALGGPIVVGAKARLTGKSQLELMKQIAALKAEGLISTVPTHHDAMVSFTSGEAAAALVTTSSFETAAQLAHFPFAMLMPPYLTSRSMQTGGADLVLPRRLEGQYDVNTRRDIATFISWLLSPRINAAWAVKTGYLPVIKLALGQAPYQAELERVGHPGRDVLTNKPGWQVYPFHRLESFCMFEPLASLLSAVFKTTLTSADPLSSLKKGEEEIARTLNHDCR